MDRYEEALERAKKGLPIDEVFPELKESDDERIRKEIHAYLFNTLHNTQQLTPRTNELERWLAYLEKQKEWKPAEWSEEDSVTLDCAVEVIEKAGIPSLAASLKSLKNRGNSQKSNTNSPSWKPSKKQIVALGCVRYVDRNCATELESLYNDLKKL